MAKAKTSKKKRFGKEDLKNAALKPLLIIGGVVGGHYLGKAIDKLVKVDETTEGFQIKKVIAPVVLTGLGVAANLFMKDENIKLVANGVTGAGVIKGVSVMLKKDVLNGFKGLGDAESSVKQLTIEPYNPELPELNGEENKYLPIENVLESPEDYTEIGTVETYVS